MAKVTILNYEEFVHQQSGVSFARTLCEIPLADGATGKVYRGVATVDDKTALAHFAGHEAFLIEGVAPAALEKWEAARAKTAEKAAAEAEEEAKAAAEKAAAAAALKTPAE